MTEAENLRRSTRKRQIPVRFGASGVKSLTLPPTSTKRPRARLVSRNESTLVAVVHQTEDAATRASGGLDRREACSRSTQTYPQSASSDDALRLREQVRILLKNLVEANMKLSKSEELRAKSEYERAKLILEKEEIRKSTSLNVVSCDNKKSFLYTPTCSTNYATTKSHFVSTSCLSRNERRSKKWTTPVCDV